MADANLICRTPDCAKPGKHARGLCVNCYQKMRREKHKAAGLGCSVPDCDRVLYAREMCALHYQRLKDTGTTDLIDRRVPAAVRVWKYIDAEGPCWEWTGHRCDQGYGKFKDGERSVKAHRFVWETLVGPIPDGLELDHLCRNTSCSNPDHLEPVTHQENMRRGVAGAFHRRKTHCPSGHPYNDENTGYDKSNHRYCRACGREDWRRRSGFYDRNPHIEPDSPVVPEYRSRSVKWRKKVRTS